MTGGVLAQHRAAIVEALEVLRFAAGNFYFNDKPTVQWSVSSHSECAGERHQRQAGSILNLLRWVSPRSVKEMFVLPTD